MSTSDGLSTATKRLSLSTDSHPDFLSPFTLISADGHRFSVNPLMPAGASKVFRDMLSTGGGERECKLTESEKEVELFLATFEKEEALDGEEDWYTILKMSDKYDAQILKGILRSRLSSWSHSNPVAAYAATALLGNAQDLPRAARKAVSSEATGLLFKQLSELDRLRLTHFQLTWRDSLKSHLLDSITSLRKCTSHGHSGASAPSPAFVHLVVETAAARVPALSTTADGALYPALRGCVYDWPECASCFWELHGTIDKLQQEWIEKEEKIPFFE